MTNANTQRDAYQAGYKAGEKAERERIIRILIEEDARILMSKYDDYPEALTSREWVEVLGVDE